MIVISPVLKLGNSAMKRQLLRRIIAGCQVSSLVCAIRVEAARSERGVANLRVAKPYFLHRKASRRARVVVPFSIHECVDWTSNDKNNNNNTLLLLLFVFHNFSPITGNLAYDNKSIIHASC
jgi:hypothetical protein